MPKSDSGRGRVSAADLLAPVLLKQATELRAREANLRLARPQAVRKFLVASWRLGGSLTGFASLLDPVTSEQLVRELRNTAAAVSSAGDAESVLRRIDSLLQDEPTHRDESGTRERLAGHLLNFYRASLTASLDHLDSPDYDVFVRRMESFADLPPWTDTADRRAEEVLRPLLRAEWGSLIERTSHSSTWEAAPDRDERMHDTRVAAQRVRYVCEALVPLFGNKVKRMGKAAARLQTVLGEHEDCVLTQRVLFEAGEEAFRDGGEEPLLWRLHGREASAAAELRVEIVHRANAVGRPSLRRWLR